jgi:ATP-dependent helicase/nuclease subunit A
MSALSSERGAVRWTEEQALAIERRDGNLLLDAGAGSGKTSVLVERFARAVLEDGVEVGAILTITFTDKAAAELRDRVRQRLHALGADEAARATEGAFISTIHGFCARVLRAHALAAGIDPRFVVLDQPEAQRLTDAAFDDALERLASDERGAVDLIASYSVGLLRGAILGTYSELRSRGQTEPELPPLPPAPDLDSARAGLRVAAEQVRAELGELPEPTARVLQALERVGRCEEVLSLLEPGIGELDALKLPGGNGAALSTPLCVAYGDALAAFRGAFEHRLALGVHELLGRLLRLFGDRYAQRKRARSALDFEDLELMTRDLIAGDGELRERYRSRFAHVMVDELQDTNRPQLELIEHVAHGNLFTVGDAQQSIYAFRHADVELFERLGEQRARDGERATLRTNFRSRREILDVINGAFAGVFGEGFMPLVCGRADAPAGPARAGGETDAPAVQAPACGETDAPAGEPRVELLVADKGGDYAVEGLASPWRIAEAGALAGRVDELIAGGASPREIVVLTRATTDLRVYERALEERGIPTYVIGGRGYWAHPQVIDMVAYLRTLANPLDEEPLYTVLASPLVAVSVDALVVLAAAARSRDRDPWWVLREPGDALDSLAPDDRARLARFAGWFAAERGFAGRLGIEELIDRALALTGYDLTMLAMPGGRRRLANVRKLMRLGREFEAASGPDLRGFVELVRDRDGRWGGFGDARESEAPVEGEALDAIRLMTIHRAKGLEFEIVCVADLGRGPRYGSELLRIGRDGRFGIRLGEPGTGRPIPALAYRELGDEQAGAAEREERRLFYVAMTRARERLILSGAAKLDAWDAERSPMGWIAPALAEAGVEPRYVAGAENARDVDDRVLPTAEMDRPRPTAVPPMALAQPGPSALPGLGPPPVTHLSYSALGEYARCGYRFYVERVLGVPPVPDSPAATAPGVPRAAEREAAPASLTPVERGILVHALLEKLDFRRPVAPTAAEVARAMEQLPSAAEHPPSAAESDQIAALIKLFVESDMRRRLAAASDVRREVRFAFPLEGHVLINGALDALAREPAGRMLVVDYKSDRLEGADPGQLVLANYATQRLVYALAALRAGAREVEVAHLFLEAPREPVIATFGASDAPRLERELAGLAAGVLRRDFEVTEQPHRGICNGCPAEGGLCSWPLSMTRREAADRLF